MTPEETLAAMGSVLTDLFYWVSIALMIAIHAGFLAYETAWRAPRTCWRPR